MIKKIILPTMIGLALVLSACNGCSSNQKIDENTDPLLDFESINIIDSIDAVFYALPSPEEIITYINDNKVKFDPSLMHNSKLAKMYEGYEKKALICGIYFADLAYISAFNKSDFAGEYISTVDYLLKELNINPNFSKEQQMRILDATLEPDSMYAVSRELYDTVISYLQEYDNGKTLSLLSAGAFIESLYLTTSSHVDFDKQKNAIDRIAEQKLLFQDIVTMVKTYESNPALSDLINDLHVLEKSYNNLNIEFGDPQVNQQSNGSLRIESKNEITLTEENYFIFSDNVQDFRTKMIRQ
ncbi:hypothetical protein SAMN06265379_101350 [Saccharicrinis carchari]|uniref:Lipoprotein n=1 Tax=Saccharicrinis carchari TaxID=1168039 RepID=A0A521AS27_SACCC|nr:hypothetical protein [Saccharicrinis carchari]SMO37585.1 hypothetical protein SAMN06265379_101350 [Saccharicrinis carchari]